LGPSGIGKSTLFELIAGLRIPTKGSVQAYSPKLKTLLPVSPHLIGMVYQTYDLYPFLKVRTQLELGAKKGGCTGTDLKEKVEYYLDHFRLRDHATKYPNELSGGQRQRLAIAQQLLCSSTVLLMDEPFSGLDPLMKAKISELIADIAQLDELRTIVIVSHDIEPTLAISDTVWLMGKNADGSASIVETIDMIERGFTWRKDVRADRAFQQLVFEVNEKFKVLSDGVVV
ncbi:MAG: ATP-binding cassette domain-containing protein, partial [Saprospiraceae bacterium]|nr:ATP-binding cassette domain-containing protein [Saprospiraceae bacterium]